LSQKQDDKDRFANHAEDSTLLSQTACYVPRPVTQSLVVGNFNFLAELRSVTTVFTRLDGYNHVEHEDLLSLQKFFYACQDILIDSGGFLRQFLVDDKGCVLIVLWGVPTATFHDDSRRALGATIRIRSKLLDMKMPCSCGITTGIAYCGTVGNELRREYAAVGDTVNLAARLMGKANGEILLDAKTYLCLPAVIHRKLTKKVMILKGKEKPITTYLFNSTDGMQADGCLSTTMADNAPIEEELPIRSMCKSSFLEPLRALFDPVPGSLQFLLLEGRPGTGREEAALWLKRLCNTRGLRVISVRLTKADASIEYKALSKIFRHLIREENFDALDRQTFVINTLLKEMYPRDLETREKVAYPTMKHALGVSCNLSNGNRMSGKNNSMSQIFGDKFEAKIPNRHKQIILKDIFFKLLKEQPTVLVIEDAHEMDEASWKIFILLKEVEVKAFIVMTLEPIKYLKSSTAIKDSSIAELIYPESSIYYDWIDLYINRITNFKKYSYLLLPEFTFQEIRVNLAQVLGIGVLNLPRDLDQMVFDLCGGNPYWFEEISSFLLTYGVQEFMTTLDGMNESEGGTTNRAMTPPQPSLEGTGKIRSLKQYFSNKKASMLASLGIKRPSLNLDIPESPTTSDSPKGPLTAKKSISYPKSPLNSVSPTQLRPFIEQNNNINTKATKGSSAKLFNLLGTVKSGAKLEFLVVCRFAKLSIDEQSLARTASIIGMAFTSDVLNDAMPKLLRPYMPTILQSLVENHWLHAKSDSNPDNMNTVEYTFTHPLLHKTLYELTPTSVKNSAHLSIAKYIERIYYEDKLYFMSLGYHYSRSGDDSNKTYKYLTRAAYEMILSGHGNLDESIILIYSAASNVGSATDAAALLGVVTAGLQLVEYEDTANTELTDHISETNLFKANSQSYSFNSHSYRNVLTPFKKQKNDDNVVPKKKTINKGTGRQSKLTDIEATLELQKTRYTRIIRRNEEEEEDEKNRRNIKYQSKGSRSKESSSRSKESSARVVNHIGSSNQGSRQGSEKKFKMNSRSSSSKGKDGGAHIRLDLEIHQNTRRRSLFANVQESCAHMLGYKSKMNSFKDSGVSKSDDDPIHRLINIKKDVPSGLRDIEEWQIPLIRIRDDYLRGNAVLANNQLMYSPDKYIYNNPETEAQNALEKGSMKEDTWDNHWRKVSGKFSPVSTHGSLDEFTLTQLCDDIKNHSGISETAI